MWRDARDAVSRSMADLQTANIQTANIDEFQLLRAECSEEHPTGSAFSAPVKFECLPARRQINLTRGQRSRQSKSAEKKLNAERLHPIKDDWLTVESIHGLKELEKLPPAKSAFVSEARHSSGPASPEIAHRRPPAMSDMSPRCAE